MFENIELLNWLAPLLGIFLSISLNLVIWLIQRQVNKKSITIERRKEMLAADKANTENIQTITAQYEILSESYIDTRRKLTELTIQANENCFTLKEHESELLKVAKVNRLLSKRNIEIEKEITFLKEENVLLKAQLDEQKEMLMTEKKSNRELKDGVDILINQIKRMSVSPQWTPPQMEE